MVFVVATNIGKNGGQAVGRNRNVDARNDVGAVQAIVRDLGSAAPKQSPPEKDLKAEVVCSLSKGAT